VNPAPSVRRGNAGDLDQITDLLKAAGLPTEDLRSIAQLDIWALDLNGALVGAIALERYGAEGLVRSLVVAPNYRSQGLARLLVAKLEEDSRADGVELLGLLTQTAESFFRRCGYVNTDRGEVSTALKKSAEFRTLCPASARCLTKSLNQHSDAERRDN
jgi:N-acetylglutamate synthase-like GNAT family acetyltransferase